ncbi:phage protease [Sphingobium yanoikuyae]|uniref:phage protease n=1 Tax=Sphingobium yanoikuyae TaxID=13690 RepID=UPI0026F1F76E|nr:phage protease [Sphingobium yanoikuyae]
MKRGNQQHQIVAAAAMEVAIVDGAPARRVKLLPIGTIEMRDGRGPFLIRDRAHAEQVVAATRKWLGSADFNWDYNHQILVAGSDAEASGWTKQADLSVDDDGIYAEVDWTEEAAAKITAKKWRYISPLFVAARGTGEVLHLKNSALVNVGAIDLPAVIAAGLSGEEDDMSFALIAAALGLAATATEQECVAAAASLKAKADNAPSTSSIAIAAGLADSAGVEEIAASVTALKAGQADPAKFVPVEQVAAVNNRLATLEGERAEREVAAAIQGGKLVPALKDWGLNLFKTNEQGWRDFVGSAPVVVAAGAELGKDPAPGSGDAEKLDADEIAACALMGVSEEVFLAEKKLQKGAAA